MMQSDFVCPYCGMSVPVDFRGWSCPGCGESLLSICGEEPADWVDGDAIVRLRESADAGNPMAQYDLAVLCDIGSFGISDEEMVRLLSESAEQGFAPAQERLGMCYFHGDPTEQSYEKAFEWAAIHRQ